MKSEIQQHAEFSKVRYANCWEDADTLMEALSPRGRHCISIGSAGDNSFSLLAEGAEAVTIVEMNPAQIACIGLRMAAYQCLQHKEFLILLGELEGDRLSLYEKCRSTLDSSSRVYWDHFPDQIEVGFGRIGKFESYFDLFRDKLMPWVHSRTKIENLLSSKSAEDRADFYQKTWNTWRWRWLFKLFFSRFVMGRLGRDPAFFKYVEGSVADRILDRTRHALIELQPAQNPYLRWILNGHYGQALPHALRAENFASIRENMDKISIDARPLEEVLTNSTQKYDAFNLSDIFEYMSEENTDILLRRIHQSGARGARLAYWNMLAPRSRPGSLATKLRPMSKLSNKLFLQDKAFFYSAFIVEEVI